MESPEAKDGRGCGNIVETVAILEVAVYALLWLASLIYFVVSTIWSRPTTSEAEQRALMRSLSWPTSDEN